MPCVCGCAPEEHEPHCTVCPPGACLHYEEDDFFDDDDG
jgi:hypothetical protein